MLKFATIASLMAVALAADNPYETYPPVPKTASINGLADPINDQLPECAQPCFARSTSNTPCPYWDTGCLCVMQPWTEPVAECIANNCKGKDVDLATSLAISQCSVVGVWEPYFIVADKYTTMLQSAAAETEVETTSSVAEPTPSEEQPSQAEPTASDAPSSAESSSPAITSSPAVSSEEATSSSTSSVFVRSASINGFADPIYGEMPECAKSCVSQSTSSTPCPYWDAGCLCVIPTFSYKVAQCIAEACQGNDVKVATDLAFGVCKDAGITTFPEWNINTALMEALDAARDATASEAPASSSDVIISVPVIATPSGEAPASSSDVIISVPIIATPSSEPSSDAAPIESESASASADAPAVSDEAPAVSDPAEVTVSNTHSEVVTITSCSDDKCSEIQSTVTATNEHSEIVTITSCDENKCVESESTVVPVVTKTNNHTEIVTITSCDDQKCTEVLSTVTKAPKTTTVTAEPECITVTECIEDKCKTYELSTTQITTTVDKVETVYVSTCTETIDVVTSKSVSGTKTVDVTITKTLSQEQPKETKPVADAPKSSVKVTPTTVAPVQTQPVSSAPPAPAVSTFEGAAAVNTAGLGMAAILMALPFF
ncbi:hypothetical protein FT663_03647 [Candidozyma haemuli var. vulneris]|uniref:CFEM domain-containing protein n=1 Tax=Candidozyma haemuli TaxID=45357 RepID=A0A2V1AY03_9ASCO|nr:hypothetical protein CXQ85_002456 [[Candida] haemuloni]KAF3985791.1 hypothetical protein FT662_04933 [[Candida] haemuloni var. vulneris]KAF3989371.1 hypothetical protein FT663_03647 [[Candida] haemuloni var. vulneris]PVH22738.1 hypothetical protein CXQ85_002456 [[Candida] haemuloni]